MTMMRSTLYLLLASLCALSTSGFSPAAGRSMTKSRSVVLGVSQMEHSEADAMHTYLLHKAEECALSDSCSIDDARVYLSEVVDVLSECAAGTLEEGEDVCHDQDHVAAIVADLRVKIERGESSDLSAEQRSIAGAALGTVALVVALAIATQNRQDAVPFTPQEWWWALQGGYLDTMIAHFVRNGGL